MPSNLTWPGRHGAAARAFLALLKRKQQQVGAEAARARVLAARDRPVGVSFSSHVLAHEYPQLLGRLLSDPVPVDAGPARFGACDLYLMLGAVLPQAPERQRGTQKIVSLAVPPERKIFIEQAFLGSAFTWLPPFRTRPEAACLGYVYDDLAQYYMADYPNRLIRWLNGGGAPDAADRDRARRLMARMVGRRISKYNSQPFTPLPPTARRRVLVCDQSHADASVHFGRMKSRDFQRMLRAARRENPDAEIVVKTHPDTAATTGGRQGYFDHLQPAPSLRLLRAPVNPFCLLEAVDTVYTGTSQIGFEALMAGKRVVTFGAPFYAGWGLTEDRIRIPHRHRHRSLEELFHAAYVWYPIYHVPGATAPSEIEEVLDHIERERPVALTDGRTRSAAPDVSVIIPVHDGAAWLAEAVASVQKQSLDRLEILIVDDASGDGTAALAERLAAGDPRVTLQRHARTGGPGAARNTGLETARGTYVWFLDSDDRLADPAVLADLVAAARRERADLVRARKAAERVLGPAGELREERPDPAERHFEGVTHGGQFADLPELLHNRHCWLMLYRRAFLQENGLRFATGFWEERAFALGAMLAATRIQLCDRAATLYHLRPDSVARRRKTLRDARDMLANFEQSVAQLTAHGAHRPDSPLARHLRFTLTQFLHYLMFGFFRDLAEDAATPAQRRDWLARLAAGFRRAGMTPETLLDDPDVIDPGAFAAGRYHLALAALLAGREADLSRTLAETPYTLPGIVAEYRAAPSSDFAAALNRYATGPRVSLAAPRLARPPHARVLIHAGMSKTGTTYLQHWLNANRPQLLAQGIYYPEQGLYTQPGRPRKTGGHARFLAAAHQGDRALRDHVAAALEIAPGEIHTVLLSSEAFHLGERPDEIVAYFDGFRCEVLFYLRRQDDWAASQYREYVGGGATFPVSDPPEVWLAAEETRKRLCFSTMLAPWIDRLGPGAVHLRRYTGALRDAGRLLADFAQAAGIRDVAGLRPVNDSLRNEAALDSAWLAGMRRCNARPFPSTAAYLGFAEEVQRLARSFRPDARPAEPFGPDLRAALTAECAADNARIAERFFDGSEPLFGPSPPRPDDETAAPLSPEEAEAIEAAYRRHAAQRPPETPETAALRARIRAQVRPLPPDMIDRLRGPIRAAGLFAPDWYLAQNPDVAASGMDPLVHFLQTGCLEGRDPAPEFSLPAYYGQHPDALEAGTNALVHALRTGAQHKKV